MTRHSNPQISSRKSPQQARSNALIAAVLEAAVQVLRAEGARRFTVARVAERAGVSVGSVYQYFPNKAAILFRLQSDEWRDTSAMLRTILENETMPARQRLRVLVHAFLRSECDEAQVRIALKDAAPLYRNAPEANEAKAEGFGVMRRFLDVAAPGADAATRDIAADLIESTLCDVGSSFSEVERSEVEIARYADAMADMFCAYLTTLQG